MSSMALAPSLTRVTRRRTALAADGVLVACGVLLMAGLAQVSVPLPGTPVPLTG
jgi:hypothetical protein